MPDTILVFDNDTETLERLHALMDPSLDLTVEEGIDDISAIRRSLAATDPTKVLILSRCADRDFVLACLKAGASAYLLAERLADDLPAAIAALGRGNMFLSPGVTSDVLEECLQY